MFVSADCPVCKRALPLAQSVTQANNINLILVGEGEVAALVAMANRTPLNGAPLLISNELLLLMQIGRLPTMVALSPDGVITARDVASNRREIETLVATLPQARLPQIKESLHAAV
jgi:methylamine dehydrogenase accessory protein MauD